MSFEICLATSAMGTRFELVLVDDGASPGASLCTLERTLRAAGEEALREIDEADRRLSAFRSDSLLALIGREGAQRPVRLDDEVFTMLDRCHDVWRESRGAFDPTVAPLLEARGLRGEERRGDVADALPRVGWEHVELDRERRTIRLLRPDVALDLGGVAKGLGLDLALRALREAGVGQAFLHGGTSTSLGSGTPKTDDGEPRPWRVRVATPEGVPAPIIDLTNRSLSVSGAWGREAVSGGERVSHVLDPRTGASAGAARIAVARATSATLADALSTAVLADHEAGLAAAAKLGAEAACLLADETWVESNGSKLLTSFSSAPSSS